MSNVAANTDYLIVLVNGTALTDDVVKDVRAETAINLPGRLEVRIWYDRGAMPFTVGAEAKVTLNDAVVFLGEIVAVGVEIGEHGSEATFTAYDKAHRLATMTHTRTFLNQSYADVVSTIAGECGGLSPEASGAALTAVHPYIVQAGTNYAFLSRIAMRTGCEWQVADGKLMMRERPVSPGTSQTLTWGENLLRVRVRFSGAEYASGIDVRGWDSTATAEIVGTETAALSADYSSAPIFADSKGSGSTFGTATLKTTSVQAMTADEAAKVAKGLAVRMASSTLQVRGECYANQLVKAGGWIELKDVGAPLSGKYYCTAVEHVMGANRSTKTKFVAGGFDPSSIVDLLGPGDDGIPPWSQLGVVVGVVTNNDQVEGNGKAGPGKVIVKFPALDAQITSAPARLTAPDAGPQRGSYFVPEVDDEVLVAFEHGDPRRPIVLGSLWNSKAAPPYPTDGVKSSKVISRVIKTRLGHTLTFNDGDADDTKNLTILLADGKTTLVLGHDKIQIANDKKPISITNAKAKIEFTDAGDITISGENVTIKATTAVKIETSSGAIEAKSGADFKVDATGNANISGMAGVKVESTAITVVKGSMVKIN